MESVGSGGGRRWSPVHSYLPACHLLCSSSTFSAPLPPLSCQTPYTKCCAGPNCLLVHLGVLVPLLHQPLLASLVMPHLINQVLCGTRCGDSTPGIASTTWSPVSGCQRWPTDSPGVQGLVGAGWWLGAQLIAQTLLVLISCWLTII